MRQTNYRTNDALRDALIAALQRDGVGERGRSRWICARIAELMAADPALETVGAGEALMEFPHMQSIRIDDKTQELIDHAFRIVRSIDPQAEGIQSALVRAAIRRAAPESGCGQR